MIARPESRFISKLTKTQVQNLEELRDAGVNSRIRHRAHAVLLSFHGTTVNALTEIFQTSRNAVCRWLDRWDADGIDGLADKPRPGAPPKLNDDEQERAMELLAQHPRSSGTVLLEVKKETGKQISGDTLKRLAKKNGLVWKRMRKSLRGKQDRKKFAT